MGFDEELEATKKKIGDAMRRYREAVPLTTEQLGDLAKVHRSTVNNTENGKALSFDTLARLLSFCGLSLDDFLRGFSTSDIPEDQQEDHRKLTMILSSGFKVQMAGIRAALDEAHDAVINLKRARAPSPTPGVGQDDKVGKAAGSRQHHQRRRTGT